MYVHDMEFCKYKCAALIENVFMTTVIPDVVSGGLNYSQPN